MSVRPKSTLSTSAAEIGQLQFNERAFAQRNVPAGGVYDIIGTVATATRVGKFASLMIVNTSLTIGYYISFGVLGMDAPATLADGFFIPPAAIVFLGSGTKDYVRANNAALGVYKMQDNVVAQTFGD